MASRKRCRRTSLPSISLLNRLPDVADMTFIMTQLHYVTKSMFD